jgi:glutathione S-transferase
LKETKLKFKQQINLTSEMSQLKLYHSPYSPFSRSVLQLCHHLKLDVEVIELDLLEGEQMRKEVAKINPKHCVPTLDDCGFILWESRAILSYIAATKGQELLPASPKQAAVVNQRLFSEMGGIATKYAQIFVRNSNQDLEKC